MSQRAPAVFTTGDISNVPQKEEEQFWHSNKNIL